jgi:hypothetical protein
MGHVGKVLVSCQRCINIGLKTLGRRLFARMRAAAEIPRSGEPAMASRRLTSYLTSMINSTRTGKMRVALCRDGRASLTLDV